MVSLSFDITISDGNISGGTTYLPYVFGVTANGNAVVIEKDTSSECADLIRKYKDLLDCGAITDEEFERKKRELL